MTPERAQYLISHRLIGGDLRYAFRTGSYTGRLYDDGMTRAEHEAVLAVWAGMPGYTSFFSALCEVARGLTKG